MKLIRLFLILSVLGAGVYMLYQWRANQPASPPPPRNFKFDLPGFTKPKSADAKEEPPAPAKADPSDPAAQPSADNAPGFFKWTDERGVVHYTNDSHAVPPHFKDKVKSVQLPELTILDKEAAESFSASGVELPELKTPDVTVARKILLYGTSWCPKCKKARDLLDRMGAHYADLDVEKDSRFMRSLLDITKGYAAVPVVVVDARPIIGYRPEEIALAVKEVKQ